MFAPLRKESAGARRDGVLAWTSQPPTRLTKRDDQTRFARLAADVATAVAHADQDSIARAIEDGVGSIARALEFGESNEWRKGPDADGFAVRLLESMTRLYEMTPVVREPLRLLGSVVSQAVARRDAHDALRSALDEIRTLRDRLDTEKNASRRETSAIRSSRVIVSESPAIRSAVAQAEQVARTPATVLLLGETGSGKELFAQMIHDLSPRHQRSMIKVSCGAIPAGLIESEMFGRERGAYTGALSRQIGRFEAAHQSTIFLDEIGELPADVQVKLLRVLQERVIERLGSNQSIKVDVRIIAATNRNLEEAVEDKTFREDLFYRLNVFPIVVPPLRDRVEDVPGLAWTFVDELSKAFGKPITSISKETIRDLQRYSWPGNVRELRNLIERAVIVSTGPELVVQAPRSAARVPQAAQTLVDLEVEHIRAVLESTRWRIRGAGGAAERLGLKPTTLESRMARLGLKRKTDEPPALMPPAGMSSGASI
jgi:formate hydrogenlyase transcriptional activator